MTKKMQMKELKNGQIQNIPSVCNNRAWQRFCDLMPRKDCNWFRPLSEN